jgi:hypothetical protein
MIKIIDLTRIIMEEMPMYADGAPARIMGSI